MAENPARHHFFKRWASSVKFCAICRLPVKFAGEIGRSGFMLASMNLAAASRRGASVAAQVHGRIVEEHHQVPLSFGRGRGRVRLQEKLFDGLFFAVFRNFETLLRQVADIVAFLVRHDGIHQHLFSSRVPVLAGGTLGAEVCASSTAAARIMIKKASFYGISTLHFAADINCPSSSRTTSRTMLMFPAWCPG